MRLILPGDATSRLAFEQAVSRTHCPIKVSSSGSCDPIRGTIVTRGSDTFRASRVRLVHRAPVSGRSASSHRGGEAGLLLVMPHSGQVVHQQFGRVAETGPGEIVLLDRSAPFEFKRCGAGDIASFHLPRLTVRDAIRHPEELCAVPMKLDRGIGLSLGALCRAAWASIEELSGAEARDLVAVISRMVRMASDYQEKPALPATGLSVTRFCRAVHFIMESLDDPELRVADVAEASGLSKSHLHALMKRHGTSVGRLVREARLERCARDLADAGEARVSEIAFRWGFNDASHFSRAFRSRFGCSPNSYRAGARTT